MITQALAQNGARVYIVGRRGDVLQKSADVHEGDIIPIEGDVTDVESLKKAAAEVASKEKHVDLVVAKCVDHRAPRRSLRSSGIAGPGFDGSKTSAEDLADQIMNTNIDEARKLLDTNGPSARET